MPRGGTSFQCQEEELVLHKAAQCILAFLSKDETDPSLFKGNIAKYSSDLMRGTSVMSSEKTALSPQLNDKLNAYLEISKILGDYVGLGRAYQAIAQILVSQGEVAEAIEYLEKFMNIAKRVQLSQSLVHVCTFLGNIYNERGNYHKASEYFDQAFEAANALSDLALVNETKVYCGIGKAHNMMLKVNSHTEATDQVSIKYLLGWKENRSDMCADPFTVVEVTNRIKELDLIDRVRDELWTEVCNIVQEVATKTIPKKKKCKKVKWLSKEALQIAEERREAKEAEEIKKRWQDYTEELYKKELNVPDNHSGVVTDLELDILECEVKWTLGSLSDNKASRGDSIPAELFNILKDD
ncbi:Tetratricopeptide repeat protein 29, partial [Varanus komodoensis]